MSFSVAPLLLHSEDVPDEVRAVLREAFAAPAEARTALLEVAASALYREFALDCSDVRELVSLPSKCSSM